MTYQPDPLISIARVRAEFIDQSDMWFSRSIAKGEEIKQDVSTLENPAILEQLKQST